MVRVECEWIQIYNLLIKENLFIIVALINVEGNPTEFALVRKSVDVLVFNTILGCPIDKKNFV